MFAKTTIFTYVALALVAACLAAPAPEAKPCGGGGGGCGGCCTVERCCSVPVSSCIPIHTTHHLIPSSNCGCGGWGGYGNGGWGGWGNGGWGGCGCGCGGWGYGGWGGCGCGCGC